MNNGYSWCVATGIDTSPAIESNLCAGAGLSWISQVNAEAFGGFSDWRIPTRQELATIHNGGACQANTPCTDPIFGPSLYVGFTSDLTGIIGGPYWASNMEFGQFGFVANFLGGLSNLPMSLLPEFQALEFPVRAVRTGQ